jgi:hypothetical protein
MKHTSCPLNLIYYLLVSVVSSLVLCKPALAEDESASSTFWTNFNLGGYSSAGVSLNGKGDVSAALEEISLILSWEGNSRFRFFSELELEDPINWNDKEHFNHEGSYLDLERFYLDYNLSEKVSIRAGRFLTPVSRWNLLHAAPLVWTTTRPLATSRLFPIATNGIMLYGAIPLNNQGLEYNVFFETLEDQHRDGDETLFKDVHGAHFTMGNTTNIGISVLAFKERFQNTPQFNMLGIDFLTHYKGWEFSGEGFQRFYTNGNNGGSGAYLQTVAPLGKEWFAIARIETFQRPEEGSSDRWLIGTAWRMTTKQVLKMEIVGGDEDRSESHKGFLASFAILF